MWTYLLGPFLSPFPRPWRKAPPFSGAVHLRPAWFVTEITTIDWKNVPEGLHLVHSSINCGD